MHRWRCGSDLAAGLLGSGNAPLRATASASARWTTSLRWGSTGPVKQLIQVGPSSPTRMAYSGSSVVDRLEATRLGSQRLDPNQGLACAPPAPPSVPAPEPSLPNLLDALRTANSSNNPPPPTTILKSLRQPHISHSSQHSYPPTPPPSITLPTPDPHPASPHALAAFILQCIALGVSAWGLTLGRPNATPAPVEADEPLAVVQRKPKARWEESEEVFALNLLLSAYVAPQLDRIPTKWGWPKVCVDYGIKLRGLVSHGASVPAVPLTLDGRLAGMAGVLNRFDPAKGVSPDRWTIAAVLATVNTAPYKMAGTDSTQLAKFEASRPLLARWAWKSYVGLRTAEGAVAGKLVRGDEQLIGGFIRILGEEEVLDQGTAEAMLEQMVNFSLAPAPAAAPASTSPAAQPASDPVLLVLGHTAMQRGQMHLVPPFFSVQSPLPPIKRAELALEFLNHLAVDPDGRRERELVCQAAEVLAQFAEASVAAEVTEPEGTQWRFGRKLMVRTVECLIEAGLKVDVPLEGFMTRIAVAVLRSKEGVPVPSRPSADEYPFEMKLLRHLSHARHPFLTRRVFDAIPADQVRAEHFSPLLRSHHQATSRQAWLDLRRHSHVGLTTDSLSARMSSHLQTGDWTLAKYDLDVMRKAGVVMDRRLANKVLSLVVRFGSDRELERARFTLVGIGKQGEEMAPDTATFTTLLGAATRGRLSRLTATGPAPTEARCSRRGPRFGAAQLRAVRREVMTVSRREAGRRAHQSVDPTTGDDFVPTTNEVTKNVLLRSILRWTQETRTAEIISLVRQHLGVDLALEACHDALPDEAWKPDGREWGEWRRARWRMVEKALRNRGERVVVRRVEEWRRFEEGLVWEAEGGVREKGWDAIESRDKERREAY